MPYLYVYSYFFYSHIKQTLSLCNFLNSQLSLREVVGCWNVLKRVPRRCGMFIPLWNHHAATRPDDEDYDDDDVLLNVHQVWVCVHTIYHTAHTLSIIFHRMDCTTCSIQICAQSLSQSARPPPPSELLPRTHIAIIPLRKVL